MPYSFFYSRFPEIAEQKTRSVTIYDPSEFNLPPADYAFLEMYCDEPGCDCRRVFFTVISSCEDDVKAVISWGWEDQVFYSKWMKNSDPDVIKEMMGPVLNMMSPQSNLAPALLRVFREVLLPDTAYTERIKRHYAMFRQTVDKKSKIKFRRKKGKIKRIK
ncbi:MAG: hypothetical protein Q3M24_09070 [Candidatus Electrothrix aestuarii]|uniref:Uncharacterized protein n=1 Tax=Candidatus Electrothrix aestuarii TaxID=3062594 RepID=A0AAU8M185_9BACT|nr:hypothetical protein [Candidatus Electrothrix aestuarii]